jgi:hypothetical protein
LSIWTNNIVQKIGSHYTLSTISHIIGPNRQGWDRSGIRMYNQAFLLFIMVNTNLQKEGKKLILNMGNIKIN